MDVDKVLDQINPFGKYQKLVLVLIGLMSSLGAMAIYSTIFYSAAPEFVCDRANVDHVDMMFSSYHNSNQSTTLLIPPRSNHSETCRIYANYTLNSFSASTENLSCHFDNTYYQRSIVTDLMLVCDKSVLVGLTQTFYMLGGFLGLFIGYFSDKFGRKRCCVHLGAILSITLTVSELVQLKYFNVSPLARYVVYSISQFITGAMLNSLYSVSFILLIELTTKPFYTLVANINLYIYVLGEFVVLIIAYFSRDWQVLMAVNASYSVMILCVIIFLLPESPRFLVEKRRYAEARQIFFKMAKVNDRPLELLTPGFEAMELLFQSENSSSSSKPDKFNSSKICLEEVAEMKISSSQLKKQQQGPSVLSYIFESKVNVIKTSALVFVWFSLSLIYYGVGLGITSVGQVNPYLIFFFSSVAEMIGYMLCHLNDKFGQKRMFVIFLATAGISCLSVALIPKESSSSSHHKSAAISIGIAEFKWNSILIIVCTGIGKAMASAAYNCAYIYTSQMYPTHVRNTLVLFLSSTGRVGSLISPQINLLRVLVWNPLPYIIFSISSLASSVIVFFLPDQTKLSVT